ncbi:hypothetical protein ABIC27_003194 [Streptomyces sp. PvR034]
MVPGVQHADGTRDSTVFDSSYGTTRAGPVLWGDGTGPGPGPARPGRTGQSGSGMRNQPLHPPPWSRRLTHW